MKIAEQSEVQPSGSPVLLSTQKLLKRGWVGILGGLAAIALLGTGAMRLISVVSAPAEPDSAVEAAPQRVEVVALGRIEPQGEVLRVGGPTGERIAELRVKRGSQVKAGDVLAVLESYDEQKAQRDLAASQYAEAVRRLEAQTRLGQAQIQEAETRVSQAADPVEFEIAAQQARVRELEASLDLAEQDLQRNQSLYQEGAISRQELDQQVTQAQELREQLRNAQATLVQVERSRSADIRNARAQLQSQQANLTLSQIQAEVESSQQNLKLAEARLERTLIRAPREGRVLRIMTDGGEAIAQDGGVLELGDTRQMYVVAEVYETDIGLVKAGQRAVITSRNGAFEGTLTGTVEELGWQIYKNDVLDDDPAANADARVIEARIRLDNGKLVEGLTNLQVDVRIDVEP
ncbi:MULTISPECIES: HlyD family efflux transporter periplasmic adaptor subunit [unclassified Leptolyngbya]|uniref:efflux RND transporter periplasmic adaptor subunit n=1 Tax=unclassified Leptolyngbya TaxID=2650499 RepID=UPI001682972E|nr:MULTISPECIES: HlyD family efflux transporter periplasmic adaptor subunit [unclassified Leptolyngbya]MBD1911917.1 efflux RND transporter periplasmic adaptor subunit [Leptolyngbya sp. FACHB-8]MBD2156126.1 efflux RND transporter periplasmic adaptor subunit [Leptolyngbya sp. FACHB-16]